MPDVTHYLASRRSPAFLRDFDGRVRECSVIAPRTIRFRTVDTEGWHVRVSPPLPLRTDDSIGIPDSTNVASDLVLVSSDGQDLGRWSRDQVNVIVYSVEPECLNSDAPILADDLLDQYDAELAAQRSQFADDMVLFFDGDIGRPYTREQYIDHLRLNLPDALRSAEGESGPIERWENLQLEAFHYWYERPRRDRL